MPSLFPLRLAALHALQASSFAAKNTALVLCQNSFEDMAHTSNLDASSPIASSPITSGSIEETLGLPGRPARPELRPHREITTASLHTPEGLPRLLHSLAHIEFNAINLALDALWRFDAMPLQFYADWLQVAQEEAYHFGLLQNLLEELGYRYGDFPAHTGLWDMTEKTKADITARMALVPRTLEARGLDATPPMQAKLRKLGTPMALKTVAALDIILRDEVGHVRIGNHWYGWLCARQGLDPVAHYADLLQTYAAPRLRAPFNQAARLAAGFSAAELAILQKNDAEKDAHAKSLQKPSTMSA
jgi:uncharacterized ferritin-like protein (DUF455 family)